MTTRIFLTHAALLCIATNCKAQHPPAEVVLKKANSVFNDMTQVSLELIRLIEDDKMLPRTGAESAMYYLSMMRSREAIRPLLRSLTFPGSIGSEPWPLGPFPAAAALAAIGSEIYPEAWYTLKRECTDEYIMVLAWTFLEIDKDKDIVLLRAKKQLADPEATDLQKTNINRLIKVLQAAEPRNPATWPK